MFYKFQLSNLRHSLILLTLGRHHATRLHA